MKIAMVGYGKMGQEIERVALERGHEVISIDPNNSQAKYQSLEEASWDSFDVGIEFTAPNVVMDNIKLFSEHKKNLVVGTSGWYDQIDQVQSLVESSDSGMIYAANFFCRC